MINMRVLVLGPVKTNCYLIYTDKAAVIIDPSVFNAEVKSFCEENKGKKFAVLLTHSHFDHIMGAEQIREITNAEIIIGKNDAEGLYNTQISLSDRFHAKQHPFNADTLVSDNDDITVEDIKFKVIETPGHTAGGVSYLMNNLLFSGDTLFLESFGRTDYFGGNAKALKKSIDKLLCLPDETKVYPGHGESTVISHEKKYNVYKGYL